MKQPKRAKAKKLNKLAKRAKTNKTRLNKLNQKANRNKAQLKNKQFNWFLKHGKKEVENVENND